jgi:hypothetical protein
MEKKMMMEMEKMKKRESKTTPLVSQTAVLRVYQSERQVNGFFQTSLSHEVAKVRQAPRASLPVGAINVVVHLLCFPTQPRRHQAVGHLKQGGSGAFFGD